MNTAWTWGDFTFEVTGQLDLEVFLIDEEAPGIHVEDPAIRDGEYERGKRQVDDPEALLRLSVFLNTFYRDWLESTLELRIDGTTAQDGHAGARFEQAWVRATAPDQPALNGQIGKFAAPIGNFIPRSSSKKNPLTTWPLPYDLPTSLTDLGNDPASLRQTRDDPDLKDWFVPIWQAVYAWGLMTFGTWEDLSWWASVQTSAPATLPEDWDHDVADPDFANVYLRAAYRVHETTTIGASFSKGAYSKSDAEAGAPGPGPGPGPGGSVAGDGEDYDQTLFGLDAAFGRGLWELYAELFWTRLETPGTDDLELWTGYVEGKYAVTPALHVAARLGRMTFDEIDDPAGGGSFRWDRAVSRAELGAGYFFTANFFAKTTLQLNTHHGGREPDDHMLMFQVGLGF